MLLNLQNFTNSFCGIYLNNVPLRSKINCSLYITFLSKFSCKCLKEQMMNIYHIFNCPVGTWCRRRHCLAHQCLKQRTPLLTSVEAANSARHGLCEDHAAVTRGGAVFNVRIVIHADLWNVDKWKPLNDQAAVFGDLWSRFSVTSWIIGFAVDKNVPLVHTEHVAFYSGGS